MEDLFSDTRWPGIRDLALGGGATVRQVQKWRERKKIPGDWHLLLLDFAERAGVALGRDDLLSETSLRGGGCSVGTGNILPR